MKKPTIKQMHKRTTLWFDGTTLRICYSKKENKLEHSCKCESCLRTNSWFFDGHWWTSFFSYESMREHYEFVGFV